MSLRPIYLAFSLIALMLALPAAQAQTYGILHTFTGQADGGVPWAGVTLDHQGNIYGVAQVGGSSVGAGAIYKIDTLGRLTTLYQFDYTSGGDPLDEPLTLVQSTLYGSTSSGGPAQTGVLFSVKTDGSDYTVLHAFDGKDGYSPSGPLQPVPGNGLVGVTSRGGPGFQSLGSDTGQGVLFALIRDGQFKTLHNFSASGDGHNPNTVLVDASGNVYGSTLAGGGRCAKSNTGCGVVFKFNLNTQQYSVIYSFTGELDGAKPMLGSIGADGTLYGATQEGTDQAKYGTLFTLTPNGTGYVFAVIADSGSKLGELSSGPTLTASGGLIGVSTAGLYIYNQGIRLLQALSTNATGFSTKGQPAIGPNGTVLGTTLNGGMVPCVTSSNLLEPNGCGVVFRYTFK